MAVSPFFGGAVMELRLGVGLRPEEETHGTFLSPRPDI